MSTDTPFPPPTGFNISRVETYPSDKSVPVLEIKDYTPRAHTNQQPTAVETERYAERFNCPAVYIHSSPFEQDKARAEIVIGSINGLNEVIRDKDHYIAYLTRRIIRAEERATQLEAPEASPPAVR